MNYSIRLIAFFCLIRVLCDVCHTQRCSALQDEARLQFRIDFRDGTTLQASMPKQELAWSNISRDGTISERKVDLAKVKKIQLVKIPSTARVAKIRNLLSQLGSVDYHQRIKAQIELSKTGKEFEQIIKQYQPSDAETRWRIEKVKKILAEQQGAASNDATFDVLVMDDEEKALDGELMGKGFEVFYGSTKVTVDRSLVASITDEPLRSDFELSVNSSGGTRQEEYPDANGTMPVGMTFVDFEHLPDGEPIRNNMDVSSAFAAEGVLFETSYKSSYVGTQLYSFAGGRGGSYSIATAEPTYQGVITIRFCVPGNPRFAAGTKYVAFNVSHVNPEGTFFEAYNPQGQLISKFTTNDTGTDYLGFKSSVPIAKVIVRPNPEVDEDFAIDDLFFQRPTALLESGNPDYFSIVTKRGERLQCNSIKVQENSVVLNELSFGINELTISSKDVWVAIPPKTRAAAFSPEASANIAYCLFNDGAISLANLHTQKRLNFSGAAFDRNDVVAFWGIDQQMSAAPFEKVPAGAGIVFAEGRFFDLANIGFGETWLESPSIDDLAKKAKVETEENNGVDLTKKSYRNSPCVYLRAAPESDSSLGVIYTVSGERYFFGGDSKYNVTLSNEGVDIVFGENRHSFTWPEIRSLRFKKSAESK